MKQLILLFLVLLISGALVAAVIGDVDNDGWNDASDPYIAVGSFHAYCELDNSLYPQYYQNPTSTHRISIDSTTWNLVQGVATRINANPYTQKNQICLDSDNDGIFDEGPYEGYGYGGMYGDNCRYISNPPSSFYNPQQNVCPLGRDQKPEGWTEPQQNTTIPPEQNTTIPPENNTEPQNISYTNGFDYFVLGDSLSDGYGLPGYPNGPNVYPALLVEKTKPIIPDATRSVAGGSGSDLDDLIAQCHFNTEDTDLILVWGGINEFLAWAGYGVGSGPTAPSVFESKYNQLISCLKSQTNKPIFVGTLHDLSKLPVANSWSSSVNAQATQYITQYNTIIRNIAAQNNLSVVDFDSIGSPMYTNNYQNDGIHPNITGQVLIADRWWNSISPLFGIEPEIIPPEQNTTIPPEQNTTVPEVPQWNITNVQELPEIANVDYSKFPRDPGENYESIVTGNKYYVSVTGNNNNPGTLAQPFQTISRAIQAVSPSDAIFVRGGTYNIASILDTPLLSKNNIILTNYNDENVIIKSTGSRYGFFLEGDNIVVDGFTFEGFALALRFGKLSTERNIIIKNINIRNCGEGLAGIYGTSPAIVSGALFKNIIVQNPDPSGYVIGLHCGGPACNDVRIINANINLGGSGVGSGADGIAMENGNNILVESSIVQSTSGDGYDFKASNASIVNSISKHIARNGIKLWHGGDIINSLIFDTGADSAIVFKEDGNYRIINSVIADHNKNGLESYTTTFGYDSSGTGMKIDIINTIFHHNIGSVWINQNAQLNIKNTIFSGGTVTGRYLDYGRQYGLTQTPLTQLDPSLKEVSNVNFVNTELENFHLLENSIAIDSGLTMPLINFDLDRNPRPNGTAYDIGAYEFGLSSIQPPIVEPVDPSLIYNISFDNETSGLEYFGGNYIPGLKGNAYLFDGVDDYIKVSNVTMNFSEPFTVAFWLKTNTSQSVGTILANKFYNSIKPNFEIRTYYDAVSLYFQDADLGITYYNPNNKVNDNQWHHLVYAYNNNEFKIYLDGNLIRNINAESIETVEHRNFFFIGSYTGKLRYYSGNLDEIKIYNRTLTDAEVLNDFQI